MTQEMEKARYLIDFILDFALNSHIHRLDDAGYLQSDRYSRDYGYDGLGAKPALKLKWAVMDESINGYASLVADVIAGREQLESMSPVPVHRSDINVMEESLQHDVIAQIRDRAEDALGMLGDELASAGPATVVEALDALVSRWQKGERPCGNLQDPEEASLILGSLWGEQIVREFGWTWAGVTFHNYGDSSALGVLSPDRSLAIYPCEFILACLGKPGADATLMRSFNMLQAGTIRKRPEKSYTNVMDSPGVYEGYGIAEFAYKGGNVLATAAPLAVRNEHGRTIAVQYFGAYNISPPFSPTGVVRESGEDGKPSPKPFARADDALQAANAAAREWIDSLVRDKA